MVTIRAALLSFFAISVVTAQDATVLRITAASPLPPVLIGTTYLQTLTATGGTPPYSWGLASGTLPPGLTLSRDGSVAGMPTAAGSFTVTIQVIDSTASRVAQTFSLDVIAGATLARLGVVPHVAAGGSWNTAITLVNSSAQPVPVRVNFYADDGSALNLPLVVAQQGSSQSVTTARLDGALNPNTALVINTGALGTTIGGWAEVLSPGPLGGFAIFRTTPASGPASESTVPLQTQSPSSVVLPYDNTSGVATGLAFANPSTDTINITATIWDDSGSQLGMQLITLVGKGHTASIMPTQLPLTAGRRGIVRFLSTGTGGIAALGLRFSSFGTFTSVPAL